MKKIFVQNNNTKFINNLLLYQNQNIAISSGNCDGVLYKIHQKYDLDIFIFNMSLLTNEIIQFAIEYKHKYRIFLYHDIYNSDIINTYGNVFNNIVHDPNIDVGVKYLIPENLVNSSLYYRDMSTEKDDSIVFFLDKIENIPETIEELLYPNTSMKIRLYNNPNIKHQQNIGFVTEKDKSILLNKAKYFISHNGYYEIEALLCGCEILKSTDIKNPIKYTPSTVTYSEFMDQIL